MHAPSHANDPQARHAGGSEHFAVGIHLPLKHLTQRKSFLYTDARSPVFCFIAQVGNVLLTQPDQGAVLPASEGKLVAFGCSR